MQRARPACCAGSVLVRFSGAHKELSSATAAQFYVFVREWHNYTYLYIGARCLRDAACGCWSTVGVVEATCETVVVGREPAATGGILCMLSRWHWKQFVPRMAVCCVAFFLIAAPYTGSLSYSSLLSPSEHNSVGKLQRYVDIVFHFHHKTWNEKLGRNSTVGLL